VEFLLSPVGKLSHLLTDGDRFEKSTVLILITTLVGAPRFGAFEHDINMLKNAITELGRNLLVVSNEGIEMLDLFFDITLLHFNTRYGLLKPFLIKMYIKCIYKSED
jgi:hypothetical protein